MSLRTVWRCSLPAQWRIRIQLVPAERAFFSTDEATDPVVNLERARHLFADQHGLHSKIALLTQRLKFPNTSVRIGLIGAKKSVLNSLLADPFAGDQTWYHQFQDRSEDADSIVKFSPSFENSGPEFNLPSPFLRSNNLEFVELRNNFSGHDGCHCYLSFQDSVPVSIQNWPVYQFNDLSTVEDRTPVLSQDEVCSEAAEKGVDLLIESPQNATIYTKLYSTSRFSHFVSSLSQITEPYPVISKLYNSVRRNLAEQNAAHSMTLDELTQRDTKIRKFIAEWDEESHHEFQTVFKPYVTEYESKQLPWWKLYYRADDVQAIMAEMLKQGILTDSLRNYSYVKGQIDSFTSFQVNATTDFRSKLDGLEQNEMTTLKRKLIQEDLVILQNKAVKSLMTNLLGVQLPVLLLAIPGAIVYDFSVYSMGGLALLGGAIGFNRISKEWVKAVDHFKQDLFEKTRLALLEVNRELYNDWSVKYEEERELIYKRQQAIEAIKDDLGL